MEVLDEYITLTARGMSYDIPLTSRIIKTNCEYNNIKISEIKPKTSDGKDLSEEELEKIKKKMPIAVFSDNKSLLITVINTDVKLQIQDKINKFEDTAVLSDLFEDILKENIERFNSLEMITVSYTRNYNAGQDKLKLLNEEIEKISDWKNNKTFILSIPIEYTDYSAVYKIQKLLTTKSDDINRYYQVNASFNFRLKSDEKQAQIKSILQQQNNGMYHEQFAKKSDEFTRLIYEQNEQKQ